MLFFFVIKYVWMLQGHFQILCLSGSYLVAEDGSPRSRTGGISVSLSSPDGHVIGGGVAVLMAAGPVQVLHPIEL